MIVILQGILALIAKELATVLKDPKSRFLVIGPPILQFFIFGYAATFDLSNVRFAVLDECRTTESRELIARIASSKTFDLRRELSSEAEIDELINTGRVRLVLRIGPTFAADLGADRPARLQVLVDGRNSNAASIAIAYVNQIVSDYNRQRGLAGDRIALAERAWYNPNFSSRWYIVSCLGGVIATVVVMLLSSLSVARERESGTFDQLLVTPMTPLAILVGKAIPPMALGLLVSGVLSAAAVVWYGVPFEGGLLAAAAVLIIYMLAVSGVGLFISSLSTTMQQGLLGSFVFIMPAVLLSGFTTPIANMPRWLQVATVVNPMRWVVEALRTVFLKGGTLDDVRPMLLALGAIGALTLVAAGWLFRRRSART